jgi:septal ring factor EnvC (AmiA/AmiB activator)
MARNRRNEPAAIRFGPLVKACLICLVIVICCVGYVWQKKQINQLSSQITKAEHRLIEAREQNDKLRRQMSTLQSIGYLEARIKELNLGLAQPKPDHIWWLPEPSTRPPLPIAGQQFATGQTRDPELP